jgi:hypothetical protein
MDVASGRVMLHSLPGGDPLLALGMLVLFAYVARLLWRSAQ